MNLSARLMMAASKLLAEADAAKAAPNPRADAAGGGGAALAAAARRPSILCDEKTQQLARGGFEWEALAPIRVKGKADEVRVYVCYTVCVKSLRFLQLP